MSHDLQRCDTLLRRGRSPERIAPMSKFNSGLFRDRADANGILLAAISAAPKIPGVPLTRFGIRHLVDRDRAAMSATRSVTPTLVFHKIHGSVFIRASQRNIINHFGRRKMMSFLIHGLILYLTHSFVKYKINPYAQLRQSY